MWRTPMKIKFLGHAAFLLTAADGTRIVTDPYEPGGFDGAIGYGPLEEPADFIVVSHDHADHNWVGMVPGDPEVIRDRGEARRGDILFRSLSAYHDANRGAQRGQNVIRVIEADGLVVCHLGDLGHTLSPEAATALGSIDVLLVPVGGTFTIDAREATAVIGRLRPRIAIPMHYLTPKVGLDLAPVDQFLAGKQAVRRTGESEVEVTADALPEATEIVVLGPAL
jgi:L-ascorbate metabolism protein UlaG (beta-lactamase superfamily)